MFVLINYANELFRKAQRLNTFTGKIIGGFDKVIEYSDKDIEKTYYYAHEKIFSNPRGNGLWLWKPYFILKTLETLNDNDILFYCDSAAFFIGNAKKRITEDMAKTGCDMWVSVLPLLEKQFTSKKTFVLLECDEERYKETNQFQAGFLAFRKNENSIAFVKEWLELCERDELISSDGNNEELYFFAHREDQSLLSVLCKKKNIVPQCDPTQYSVVPEKYKSKKAIEFKPVEQCEKPRPFIVLHRTPNNTLQICLKDFACAILPRKISLKFIQVVE